MWLAQKGRLLFLEVGAGKQRFLSGFRRRSSFASSFKISLIFERGSVQVLLVNKMDREDPTARKRRLTTERFARWSTRQSPEILNRIRAADNEYHHKRTVGESQEERQKRLAFFSEYRERIPQQQSQDIVNQSLYFCESKLKHSNGS
ncbi:hypothetical protein AVEN_59523-1 [Araneus ventricosus]|uniref:Uncharacterized protein n=1 Tax=Araneus ventricosus TaxID=182803 RepID=A0A4Y2L571_ARAVE|nr:hypothetical protein AVEN_59523-1 [Araneus ventricosus]